MVDIFDLEGKPRRTRRSTPNPGFTDFFEKNQDFDRDITEPFFEGLSDIEVDPFKGTVRRKE